MLYNIQTVKNGIGASSMGHSKSEKAASHERIVGAAARRFSERGFEGASLAELMSEAGLTHGGFYKHFVSRDQLVAEATARAFADGKTQLSDRMSKEPQGGLAAYLNAYLSIAHRDDLAGGCPVAALAVDACRTPIAAQVFRDRFLAYANWVGAMLGGPEHTRRARGAAVICAAAGAIAVARTLGSEEFSSAMLDATRELILASQPTQASLVLRPRKVINSSGKIARRAKNK
jgi:TetR/AcrR family transcriptional regulator, transcriptional repressor for nem operon